ncbi:MAG: hypothetical protein Q3982_07840, partial [Phoenicibacter congonensis]|nr:hypothetical protein [Phoenicibacter congonensis]
MAAFVLQVQRRKTMCIPLWSKAEKEAFRAQHPTKYPLKQVNHNFPKADVKTFANLIYAADHSEYKGMVTIVRRPKGTTTMETVASVPAEQAGEWLAQMHVSTDADYYLTKAQFKAAQTWNSGELFALNAIWVDVDAHGEIPSFVEAERMRSLLIHALPELASIPIPNLIVYSGRGFHLVWLIEQCAAKLTFMHRAVSVYYGEAIQDLLVGLKFTKCYSVDTGYCASIAGLTRIPGTFNTHSNTYCTYEILHNRRTLLTEQYDTVEYRSGKGLVSSKTCRRFTFSAVQAAGKLRVDALLKLIGLRENWEGYRDYFLLILFSACQMAGYSNEDALRLTLKANAQLKSPLSEREVRSLLSTAVKKYYKMKNAYIVEKLNLTADEQAAIGIFAMPAGAAKRGKNQARDEKIAAKRRKENRMIMRFHTLGWSISAIAKKVNRCYNTIKKRVSELAGKVEGL